MHLKAYAISFQCFSPDDHVLPDLLVIWHHGCQLMANTCLHSHTWLNLSDKTPTTVRDSVCVYVHLCHNVQSCVWLS